ncbi:N-6 DNA Methylase [Xylanibacter ruminicola]|uniref:site-specific DNA-methyltransferase (adenine-specific) n=1 Tax=Xylanibacter ruminicola TaxID=839 RepID=A0A1H5UKD6_XYLRU|nr:class I SAM-dependent methyltransferase [Xylanibacter ruminicola]SEF75466.1 N-6 DNA Methylase [Xylanibacter ruminicola]
MQLIEDASAQKLRGAYYTPPAIASFILHWGINGSTDADILEPSCGDGVFLEQMAKENMLFHHATAVEYEAVEAEKARAIGLHDSEVINSDFHRFCLDTEQSFDLVVGNPPFIRYQYYDEGQQELAGEIFKKAGLKRSKLTNAWVTFVVGCSLLLKETGKMGFVIPSELLQVTYAQQLRKYLATSFNKINIISFENLVFEEIQQEIVLLLCERTGTGEHLIEHIEVKDAEALQQLDPHRLKLPTKQIDFHADKWTYYFLDKEELDFLNKVRVDGMPKIGTYADVEVGITTGSNGYFTVPQGVVDMYQLHEYARPMVGRSVQVNSLCFTKADWLQNLANGAKANLLVFTPGAKENGNEGTKAYIENGEQQGINKGYKTSIRDDWYVIPSIKLSDALFLRRNNLYPKFVLNDAQAYTTDTMHRVFIKEGLNRKAFVVSYYNSLSFAFAEILGRNFGGGVLELMPSEVEGVYLPYREENAKLFEKVDQMVREKKTADEILDYTDKELLQKGMGFSEKETKMARSIWYKLMGRRLNRETLEKAAPEEKGEIKKAVARVKQLNFFDVLQQYPENIVENAPIVQPTKKQEPDVEMDKNVLISLVKSDNVERYLDQSAKIYYTGKRFPSTVALNKLYYFMPYIKRKGIRDLYLIKIARVGTRKEGQPDNDPNDFRLVFEIEFVKKLFKDYKPVELEIWHTFTDTNLKEVLDKCLKKRKFE